MDEFYRLSAAAFRWNVETAIRHRVGLMAWGMGHGPVNKMQIFVKVGDEHSMYMPSPMFPGTMLVEWEDDVA